MLLLFSFVCLLISFNVVFVLVYIVGLRFVCCLLGLLLIDVCLMMSFAILISLFVTGVLVFIVYDLSICFVVLRLIVALLSLFDWRYLIYTSGCLVFIYRLLGGLVLVCLISFAFEFVCFNCGFVCGGVFYFLGVSSMKLVVSFGRYLIWI